MWLAAPRCARRSVILVRRARSLPASTTEPPSEGVETPLDIAVVEREEIEILHPNEGLESDATDVVVRLHERPLRENATLNGEGEVLEVPDIEPKSGRASYKIPRDLREKLPARALAQVLNEEECHVDVAERRGLPARRRAVDVRGRDPGP